MRLRIALGFVFIVLLGGSAAAQPPNELHFYGSCNGNTNTLTLDVFDAGHVPALVGYDVYRQPFGTCEPAVRITDTPLVRNAGQHTVRQISDPGRDPNLKYAYEIVGVDANRQSVSLYSAYFYVVDSAYVGCGLAAIAHGTVEDFGYTYRIEPCPGSCYDSGYLLLETYPPALDAYVGTGIPLLLYGDIGCGSVEGCLLDVESFVESACTVAVQPMTWSTLKTTYR